MLPITEVKPKGFWVYSFNGWTVNIYNQSSINDSKFEFCFGVANNHPIEESCTGTIKVINLETKKNLMRLELF